MKHQAFRLFAVMLSVLLITSTSARAGSILYSDVAQSIVDGRTGRPRMELRLRAISQSSRLPFTGAAATAPGSNTKASSTETQDGTQTPTTSTSSAAPTVSVQTPQGEVTGQVDTVDLGDVTGTVCDCGEVPLAGGGFPLWPFLFTPLVCVTGICTPNGEEECVVNCGPPPPPPPPPPQIPEPATLLLFGSGLAALGARARRRRQNGSNARRQASVENDINAEED
ncbi:MAG TPA: PEP-CTERM sorting domain-containing protein [Pyrinomonadaceae bacterium]